MKLKKIVLFLILVLVCLISFSYFFKGEDNVEKENLKQVNTSSNMEPSQYKETKNKGKDARTYAEEYLERQELLPGINYHQNGTPLICVIQGGEIDTKNLSEDDLDKLKYKVLKEALGEAKLEIFSEFRTSLSTAEERKGGIKQKFDEKVTLPPDDTNQIFAFESSKAYGIQLSPELTKRKNELDRKILRNMLKLREVMDGTGNNSCRFFAMESFYFSGVASTLKESGCELTSSGKKRQIIKEEKEIEDNLLQLQPELDLLITDIENYIRNSLQDPNSPLREHLIPVFFTRPFESLNFGIFELAVVGIWHSKLSANTWEPDSIQKKLDDLSNVEFFKRAFIGSHSYGFKDSKKEVNTRL